MPSDRRSQLQAFLQGLGLDPAVAGSDAEAGGEICRRRLELVDEALSHTSAGLVHNHERLEFLGDAVLRLACASFLQAAHPQLNVGRCSALRAQLVSDRWLADLALRLDLDAVLVLGPVASGDRAGRATVRAECCEALVGAIFEGWGGDQGGLMAVHLFLDPHWRRDSAELLADPLRHNWKSALQEWSQGLGLGLPAYRCMEISRTHGDPRRFHCTVQVSGREPAEGWGGSRREAEQQAARSALERLGISGTPTAG